VGIEVEAFDVLWFLSRKQRLQLRLQICRAVVLLDEFSTRRDLLPMRFTGSNSLRREEFAV